MLNLRIWVLGFRPPVECSGQKSKFNDHMSISVQTHRRVIRSRPFSVSDFMVRLLGNAIQCNLRSSGEETDVTHWTHLAWNAQVNWVREKTELTCAFQKAAVATLVLLCVNLHGLLVYKPLVVTCWRKANERRNKEVQTKLCLQLGHRWAWWQNIPSCFVFILACLLDSFWEEWAWWENIPSCYVIILAGLLDAF